MPVPAVGEALTLWMKHLVANFVTPISLPIPGWTKLYELPSRDLRKFAHDVYSGPNWGDGVNLRSFATSPLLSVIATETIVRTAVHGTAFLDTGSADWNRASAPSARKCCLLATPSSARSASAGLFSASSSRDRPRYGTSMRRS